MRFAYQRHKEGWVMTKTVRASLVAPLVKNPAIQETWVPPLIQEDHICCTATSLCTQLLSLCSRGPGLKQEKTLQ